MRPARSTDPGRLVVAHCFIMDFDGARLDQYDAVMETMALGERPPVGAIFHGAGSPAGGGLRVVDVWETPEQFESFAAEKIGPATAAHGLDRPRTTSFSVHGERRGAPAPVTFLHVVRLGIDGDTFAALDEKVGPEPIEGLVYHVHGPSDDGWVTVGYWTSRAARDDFVQGRLMPIAAGMPAPPTMEDLDLHNVMGGVG
jgi:hypothetical protein